MASNITLPTTADRRCRNGGIPPFPLCLVVQLEQRSRSPIAATSSAARRSPRRENRRSFRALSPERGCCRPGRDRGAQIERYPVARICPPPLSTLSGSMQNRPEPTTEPLTHYNCMVIRCGSVVPAFSYLALTCACVCRRVRMEFAVSARTTGTERIAVVNQCLERSTTGSARFPPEPPPEPIHSVKSGHQYLRPSTGRGRDR